MKRKSLRKNDNKKKVSLLRKNSENSGADELLQDSQNVPSIDVRNINKKDQSKVERMRYRKHKKKWLLYPEDQIKIYWDLFITSVLLISCMITPYRIAFGEIEEPLHWMIVNYTIDGFFLVDIFIIFNSAYYDEEFVIVEDRCTIGKTYLSGWFIIDFLAIFPFDQLFNADNYGELARIARFGRMYKLIKMTRLLRILKIVKERTKLLKYLNEILKIGLGFERLFFFAMIFFILCHFITCIWVLTCQMQEDPFKNTWMDDDYIKSLYPFELYITSFYYTVSTVTTVGYGDISGSNVLERAFAIVIMMIGVMSFSFASGSLSSIL